MYIVNKGRPRMQILYIYDACNCILKIILSLCPQPTRLNVIKNDNESWDYTKPYLVRRGKTYTVSLCLYLSFVCISYLR